MSVKISFQSTVVVSVLALGMFVSASEPAKPYAPGKPNQLMTLGSAKKPRFELKEITWPAKTGDAEVCVWKDDRYAAASITIDDNNLGDHEFWLEMGKKYGIKVTFFVITGRIEGGKNKTFDGTWPDFEKVLAAGHDVQSHSVTHGKNDNKLPDEKLVVEYGLSKQQVEDNLNGHKCVAIAYPWGRGKPQVCEKYYIAARGTDGRPNPANRINYQNTSMGGRSLSQINAILGKPVDKPKWLNNKRYRRGWISPLYHYLGTKKPERRKNAELFMSQLADHKDQLWIDVFANVCRYGQERDSATLKTVSADKNKIELSLTDLMRDDIFDFPLTVKVRLPDTWQAVKAKQAGRKIDSTVVKHDGGTFALVQMVPDRGNAVLTP